MEYRNLGVSGLKVSRLALGTAVFGPPLEKQEIFKIVDLALDNGLNHIDTADIYEGYARYVGSAGGTAEEILGEALKNKRDKIVLATKVGMLTGSGPNDGGLSKKHIVVSLEKSLKRLQTDYLDIYYLHKPDPETPLEETLRTLNDLLRQGKILHVGISNFSPGQTVEVVLAARKLGMEPVICNQVPYSLLKRDIEKELLPACLKYAIGIIPYQVLQKGILTGKYKRAGTPPEGSRLYEKSQWIDKKADWVDEPDEKTFKLLDTVSRFAAELNKTMSQYAIAWVLSQPGITSAVVGIKKADQLKDNLGALGWEIPAEQLEQLKDKGLSE